jgi:hypothetical protein
MSMSGPRAPRWCSQGGGPGAEARQFPPRICWSDAAVAIGTLGLHFHDLRHTRNMLAAQISPSARPASGIVRSARRPGRRIFPWVCGGLLRWKPACGRLTDPWRTPQEVDFKAPRTASRALSTTAAKGPTSMLATGVFGVDGWGRVGAAILAAS